MLRQVDLSLLNLPPHILELAEHFTAFGLKLILVGGATRDFFLKGARPHDYDLEVRTLSKLPKGENWVEYLHQVIESLKTLDYTFEKLPFEVYRLIHAEYGEVEIASARVEEYSGGVDFGAFGHSDFLATPTGDIDDEQAFRRRDFTINAIGIDLMTGVVHDPFGGVEHIKQKVLHPCFDHFFNDPVRLLRLIRFELQLGFSPSAALIHDLGRFSLLKCSSFYLEREANKTNPLLFYKKIFELPHVRLPKYLQQFKASICFPDDFSAAGDIKNTQDLFFYLVFNELFKGDIEQFILLIGEIFKIPHKNMAQVVQQKSDLWQIKSIKKDYFKDLAHVSALHFCRDNHVFALTRLINSFEQTHLRIMLERFSPAVLKKTDWVCDIAPLITFQKELGEKYLPENKELWRNLPTYLSFLRLDQ